MKFGVEVEAFVLKHGEPIVVPHSIPSDECGYLVEARGKPMDCILEAFGSVGAAMTSIESMVAALGDGHSIDYSPIMKIGRELRIEASRQYAKGITSYQNLYGHTRHKNAMSESTAGIHVSLTNPERVSFTVEGKVYERTVNKLFDFATVFSAWDEEFKGEIAAAKRRPGFYELKPDGRVEYRSLPTVPINELWSVATRLNRVFNSVSDVIR